MKLRGMDPAHFDRCGESHAVVAPGTTQSGRRAWSVRSGVRSHTLLFQTTLGQSRPHGPRYNRIIRVHEVEVRARRDAVEKLQVAGVLDAIPAHVRNLSALRQPPH